MNNSKTKVHYALCRFIPLGSSEAVSAKALAKVKRSAHRVQSYWRYYNDHNWDIKFEGFVIKSDVLVDPPYYARKEIDEHLANNPEQIPDGFEYTHTCAWGTCRNHVCGQAQLGGNRCMVRADAGSGCGEGTIAHESAHNLDLAHSGVIYPDGTEGEYKDESCLLGGGGRVFKGLCSFHLLQIKAETEKEVLTIRDEPVTQVLLRPTETGHHGMWPGMYQHVILKKKGHDDIHLSIRKKIGHPFPPPYRRDTLYAHIIQDGGRTGVKTKLMLPSQESQVGTAWPLPNGMVVVYHEWKNEIASITVLDGQERYIPVGLDIPDGFAPSIPSAAISEAHRGFWYNRKFTGQGIDIHVDESRDLVCGYLYSFDEKGERRIYWMWSCSIDECLNQFDIYKTRGGTWITPGESKQEKIGIGKLEFFDNKNGVFYWDTIDQGWGEIELVPAHPPVTKKMSGVWYDEKRSGTGFTLQFFNGFVSGKPEVAGGFYAVDFNGGRVWVTLNGASKHPDRDSVYDATLYETTGGQFMYITDVKSAPIGKATIVLFEDSDEIEITYEINRGSTLKIPAGSYTEYLDRLI